GIKPQDHERVFREFEQVDSSYGRQQQGTGLGLALTKRLVEMHGGQINVQSEGIEGHGSIFTFVIPVCKPVAPPARTPPKPEVKDESLRPRILVLANENSNQELIGNYLVSAGYEVSAVLDRGDLKEALQAETPFAVVAHVERSVRPDDKELTKCRSQI